MVLQNGAFIDMWVFLIGRTGTTYIKKSWNPKHLKFNTGFGSAKKYDLCTLIDGNIALNAKHYIWINKISEIGCTV